MFENLLHPFVRCKHHLEKGSAGRAPVLREARNGS